MIAANWNVQERKVSFADIRAVAYQVLQNCLNNREAVIKECFFI